MAKIIVMHMSVDLDATTSAWLLKRYLPGCADATYQFVPAGKTLEGKPVDSDPNVLHVDTGMGLFDHHQFADDSLSATRRVFDYLLEKKFLKDREVDPLTRIVNFVTLIDHFGEVYFPDPTSDLYDFSLFQLTEGLKATGKKDEEVCEFMFSALDAVLEIFKKKINAEAEIKLGFVFENRWGKAIAMETQNEETMKLAMKQGFKTVIKRNPKTGAIRIKTLPEKEIDLTEAYEVILKLDPEATWFLHVGKHMLLNGSSKDPNAKPSSLSLKKVIEILS